MYGYYMCLSFYHAIYTILERESHPAVGIRKTVCLILLDCLISFGAQAVQATLALRLWTQGPSCKYRCMVIPWNVSVWHSSDSSIFTRVQSRTKTSCGLLLKLSKMPTDEPTRKPENSVFPSWHYDCGRKKQQLLCECSISQVGESWHLESLHNSLQSWEQWSPRFVLANYGTPRPGSHSSHLNSSGTPAWIA